MILEWTPGVRHHLEWLDAYECYRCTWCMDAFDTVTSVRWDYPCPGPDPEADRIRAVLDTLTTLGYLIVGAEPIARTGVSTTLAARPLPASRFGEVAQLIARDLEAQQREVRT